MSPAAIEFPAAGLGDGAITLRLIADADLPAVVEAVRDPAIRRFTTIPTPYGPEQARQWQRTAAAGIASGTELATLIADAADGRLLGAIGLHNLDRSTGRCAAGYWVVPSARCRGVATRALRLISSYAFGELRTERIELWIEPSNRASQRVAEAAGFTREGLLRSFTVVAGRRRDMLMYSLLAGEPAADRCRPRPDHVNGAGAALR